VTTSATSSYRSGPVRAAAAGRDDRAAARRSGRRWTSPAEHTVRAVCRDLGPIMEQVGEEEIRERLAGIVRMLRPSRGERPPVPSHQPEPGNEEERA
jgi:hypothetical protein